jgi:thiol:disulfide interchange protein
VKDDHDQGDHGEALSCTYAFGMGLAVLMLLVLAASFAARWIFR